MANEPQSTNAIVRLLDLGEDLARIGVGLTILNVNRIQVQRRSLLKALSNSSAQSPTAQAQSKQPKPSTPKQSTSATSVGAKQ